jgi:SAM-dependent methyltransferase
MTSLTLDQPAREEAYGQRGLTLVDRLGVYLSRRAILRHLPQRDDLDVLDLGCGYHATLLQALLPHVRRGVGVDLHVASELKQVARLAFIESALETVLPGFDEETFDVILFISVLEHLWRAHEAVAQCERVLRPGGVLLLNVPTWRGKAFLEFSAFRLGTSPALEMDDHKAYYNKRDLWPLLVRAGFKPSGIRLKYHKFGLNLFAIAKKA